MKLAAFNRDDSRIFDYLVVGAGISGATIARELAERGYTVGVFETRSYVGGNCYTEQYKNIDVHMYGAHIFRTSKKEIWDYVNQYHSFHPFVHKVLVEYKGIHYSFPINFTTLQQVYPEKNITTPSDAKQILDEAIRKVWVDNPKNLEEQAKNLVGEKLFNIFIKGYTEKQWGKRCSELPPEIIKRIPVRFLADDNYFSSDKKYQGIPDTGGYTRLISNMLDHENITLFLNVKLDDFKYALYNRYVFYTGALDELFDNKFGHLEWRSLKFKMFAESTSYFQPTPVVNFTEADVPYTRIIEHKQFNDDGLAPNHTIITYEYPDNWEPGKEKYYPVNTPKNNELYVRYRDELTKEYPDVIPCGRLGAYKYYDMDVAIETALELVSTVTQFGW